MTSRKRLPPMLGNCILSQGTCKFLPAAGDEPPRYRARCKMFASPWNGKAQGTLSLFSVRAPVATGDSTGRWEKGTGTFSQRLEKEPVPFSGSPFPLRRAGDLIATSLCVLRTQPLCGESSAQKSTWARIMKMSAEARVSAPGPTSVRERM